MKPMGNIKLMLRLSILVGPLAGFMALAVVTGILGHLAASGITLLGAYAILLAMGISFSDISLPFLFSLMVGFGLLRGLFRYAEQAFNHYIAFKLLALIRSRVFTKLRTLCPAKLERRDKGDLITMITTDIELLEVFFAHTISPVLIALICSCVFCIGFGRFHPLAALTAALSYLGTGILLPVFISLTSRHYGENFRRQSGEMGHFVLDSLKGLPEIIQFCGGKRRLDALRQRNQSLSREEKNLKTIQGRNLALGSVFVTFFTVTMFGVTGFLYRSGEMDFSGLLFSCVGLMSSFGPVLALSQLGSTLQNTFGAGRRILALLDEEPLFDDIKGKEEISFRGLSADSVTFSYGKETILDGISLRLHPGEILGISGKSGSGKSTLLRLFMRFWEPQKGDITLSGVNLQNINTENLRRLESFVTQDTHLFQESITENLRAARPSATSDELEAACKKAAIHEFIASLPQGYDTIIEEGGGNLSGGERQRLGLARAFLHDAPLILLDEPTGNLDSLNEALILRSLVEQKREKTYILVSHRSSTLAPCDRILTMNSTRIR